MGDYSETEKMQRQLCEQYKTEFVASPPELKLGIALATLPLKPLYGLRHPPAQGTCGWYIWGGQKPDNQDFFDSLHVSHLTDRCPSVMKFLGLPPGYGFLFDGDYLDIWSDAKLLEV